MAANSVMPSVLGNVVAQRQKLSAIRQRLSLEPSSGAMRAVAPSTPNGPANKPGAALQAVGGQEDFDPTQFQIPPEKKQAMLAMAQQFIEQVGPQQQAMIDQQRQDVQTEMPDGTPVQTVRDPKIVAALSPLADFFRQNGRLPSPQELQQMSAAKMLEPTLGRKPTETEVRLYMEKPPKVRNT